MQRLRSPYNPIHIPLGLIIWSLYFIALYGGLSVGCSLVPPPTEQGAWTWLNAVLGLTALLTVALLLWLARLFQQAARRVPEEPAPRFVAHLCAGVHLIAAIATLFIALPIVSLPPCV
ncbi:MAG: hypothetical protein ACN6O6_14065 [Pseudomonas sp.]|uniref:hypothetical protein n=1 Tax=Pseudomonas sp. TaxID=306 RepID=UPI003D14ADF4